MDERCRTRYPLLLVHGLGFHDHARLNYWGRIPEKLREHGAEVFYGGRTAMRRSAATAGFCTKGFRRFLPIPGRRR